MEKKQQGINAKTGNGSANDIVATCRRITEEKI